MPRLETFDITIRTGERGLDGTPRFSINGFPLEFDTTDGSATPGGVLEATGNPGSYPHSLVLVGPEASPWDIEEVEITYYMEGSEPYTVYLGPITLETDADLSLLYDQPLQTFDV